MYDAGARVFVEVGPRSVLSGLTGQILGGRAARRGPLDRTGRLRTAVAVARAWRRSPTEGVAVRLDRLLRGRAALRVNLDRLTAAASPQPPGAWLVDGGRARPGRAVQRCRRVPLTDLARSHHS